MTLLFVPGAGLRLTEGKQPSGIAKPQGFTTQLPTCRRRTSHVYVSASLSNNARTAAAAQADAEAGSGPAVAYAGLSPVTRWAVAVAAAAATGTAGAFATPKSTPAFVRPAAAGVVAVGTLAGVKSMDRQKAKAAKKALAKLFATYALDDETLVTAVAKMPSQLGLDKETMKEVVSSMYQLYLMQLLQYPEASYTEMTDVISLKTVLGMSGADVGDAQFEVCRAFYRANVVYLDALDDDAGRDSAQAKLNKLCFLSERVFSDKETDEARTYEISRMLSFFAMDESDFNERVEKVALPFYKEVVARACTDPKVDAMDLQIAQVGLGIQEKAGQVVRMDAYADTVNNLVTNKGKLEANDQEALARLRMILNVAEDRATTTLMTLAEPVYRQDVAKALDAVAAKEDSYASIYGRLALRQSELGIPQDAARASMCTLASSRAADIVKKASKFLRVQNVTGCVAAVKELLEYCDDILALVAVGSEESVDDAKLISQYIVGLPDAVSSSEPRSMYRLFLSDILADRVVSEKEEVLLVRLRTLLGLSELDALNAFKSAAGPVYSKAVKDALLKDAYDDATKSAKDKIKEDLSLPRETTLSIDLELYRERLSKMVEGNRIIQEQEAQTLFTIRQFLDLKDEDVKDVHRVCCGPVYEQSVSEAMGATGIILDDYREGLDRLKGRLLLADDVVDAAFHRVVKRRMKLYVNRAMEQLEKRSAVRGSLDERDVGDDPNIKRAGATLGIDAGGLAVELNNLVEFYVRNKLPVEQEVEAEGETKKVVRYPVSLNGELEPKVYNELYKQYVIQCFSASTRSEKQRLFASLDQLGPILGMTESEVTAIHSSIGTVIYKNYLDQCLLKGPIQDADKDFLSNIQKMLTMTEDTCAKLTKDAKENRVSILLERIFAQPKVLPETVKAMRATAKALEVDIVDDLETSNEQRKRLFSVEIDAAIEAGQLTAEKQELVAEVQGGLKISDEDAKEVLLACIQRRTLSHLVQAAASLRQDRSESVVSELRTMLQFGKLLPSKVIAPAVSDPEKQEMFLLYQADLITDGAVNESSTESLNLLKTLLGFTDADLEAYAS